MKGQSLLEKIKKKDDDKFKKSTCQKVTRLAENGLDTESNWN